MTDSTFARLRRLFVLLYVVLIVSPNAVARFRPHKRPGAQVYLYNSHKDYEVKDFAATPTSSRVLHGQLTTKLSF